MDNWHRNLLLFRPDGAPPDFSFYGSEVHPAQRTWWPPPRFQRSDDPKEDFWLLTLPYWALMAGYLAAWTGLWIWTIRRRKRLLPIAGETPIPLKRPPAPANY